MQPKIKKFPKQRHFLATFFFSFFWGVFGVDRMYLGKWGTGILKLVTIGGLGIWVLSDLATIMAGKARDKQGRDLLEFNEYKKLAYKVTLFYALAIGLVVLINGVVLIATIGQLFDSLQTGTIPGLGGGSGIPGVTPEQAEELGL